MSQVLDSPSITPAGSDAAADSHAARAHGVRAILGWGIAASLLLIGTGVGRTVQTRYYQEEDPTQIVCPFSLHDLPKSLDGWHMIDGSETVLDPLTTRITGSTDHIISNYVDEQTGVTLSVMVLYGPAEPVLPHIPEVCYPSSGFKSIGANIDRVLPYDNTKQATFRSGIYAKSGGRFPIQESAYYSFRHDGVWIPWISTKNSPRKNPGIFKMQIQRRMTPGEGRFQDEPIEDFVKKMVPALEKLVNEASAKPAKVASHS